MLMVVRTFQIVIYIHLKFCHRAYLTPRIIQQMGSVSDLTAPKDLRALLSMLYRNIRGLQRFGRGSLVLLRYYWGYNHHGTLWSIS